MKRVFFGDKIVDAFSNAHYNFYQLANTKSSSKSIFLRNIIKIIEYN